MEAEEIYVFICQINAQSNLSGFGSTECVLLLMFEHML